MKICSNCKLEKPLTEYHKKGNGFRSHCKTCRSKGGRLKSKEIDDTKLCLRCKEYKNINLFNFKSSKTGKKKETCRYCESLKHKTKYGITTEQYKQMLVDQNNLCKICNLPESSGRELYVDHNHLTNEVRGLLCNQCNTALGKFKDNPELLRSAIKYLTR